MEQCDFPRCKLLSDVGYIGCNLCYIHWEQIAKSTGKTEKGLLKKIGLIRHKNGKVILVKGAGN